MPTKVQEQMTNHLPEWLSVLGAGILSALVFAFGESNVGFLVMILGFMLVESFACMIIAGLGEGSFGLKDLWRFWIRKVLLLMLPLMGAAIDWAWYLVTDPEVYLGADIGRYVTKTMMIGVLGFSLREVLKLIIMVYKDLPFAKMLMHQLDKMTRGGQEPPLHRRDYDNPKKDKELILENRSDRSHR